MAAASPQHPLSQFYRPRDLAARLGISPTTIWRMCKRGEFPAPIQLSPGAVGWSEATILSWLDSREAAADHVRAR